MNRPVPAKPSARPITEALQTSASLRCLMARIEESRARLAHIQPVLPPALRPHVQPGTLDDESWCLLAPNNAVAAKLRHCLPAIEQTLAQHGWRAVVLRVKVQSVR